MSHSAPNRALPTSLWLLGCQTATVVGPAGEEVWIDKYGRIKVHFHWDRIGKKSENASCWIRVSQNWAGGGWGAVFHPRIGQEVVVQFLEGDPDRPVVIGRVYNEDRMPPYELPANGTVSTIKTRSTPGGQAANCNEIRFEDKKGEEDLLFHAEKNQTIEVEKDESHTVGNDRIKDIKNNETTTIGNDRTENVGNDEKVDIAKNRSHTIGENETQSVGKNRSTSVSKNDSTSIGENSSCDIGKNMTLDVGENHSISVGKDGVTKVGKNFTVDAADAIQLKCGKASITLKKDGTILLEGKDIQVKGSGKINVKASKDIIMKGKKIAQN
ncbi:MAG: type VI secretion system tip protein VgrG [Chitinivibrionales bacterium]|nr:type VI secretion system tip protein VgrG [Chitinivibrionales bacterium]MBD3356778.1 type VI secretion system tip protein VgrG [Chitinivibrionales bacterium]